MNEADLSGTALCAIRTDQLAFARRAVKRLQAENAELIKEKRELLGRVEKLATRCAELREGLRRYRLAEEGA